MIRGLLPYILSLWLFLVGLYGIITSRNFLHVVMCLSIVQSSTYVLLLAIGYRNGGAAPGSSSSARPARSTGSRRNAARSCGCEKSSSSPTSRSPAAWD